MKKLFYALGIIALMWIVSGCVDPVDNTPNPDYDPVKDAVTTKFIINIAPSSGSTETKMTANSVQAAGNFRGMENATLFTLRAPHDGMKVSQVDDDGSGNHVMATAYYPMTTIFGAEAPITAANSNRIITLTLPRETNTLIFYGQAITGSTADEFNEYGGLQYTGLYKDLTKIGCNAMPRLDTLDVDVRSDFLTIGDVILEVMNTLFKTGINNTSDKEGWQNLEFKLSGEGKSDTGDYVFTGKKLLWSAFSGVKSGEQNSPVAALFGNSVPATPLEQVLGITYDAMVHLNEIGSDPNKVKELRAGSGPALLRQARDLYTVVTSSLTSSPMDDNEKVALCIFKEIKKYLEYFFDTDGAGNLIAWKNLYTTSEADGIIKNISTTLEINPSRSEGDINDHDKYTIAEYPFHFNLPMGAVTLIAAPAGSGNAYQYQRYDISLEAMGGGSMTVFDYTYPPALVYYGNSRIRMTEANDVTNNSFPNGVVAWESYDAWKDKNAGWQDSSHVTINTRGVAMSDNVHYGNAMLQTTVKFSQQALNQGLLDNNLAVNGDPNKTIWIGGGTTSLGSVDTCTLQLTGILIGGQPTHVGWNYLPHSWYDDDNKLHSLSYTRMVYDKRMNGATAVQDGNTGVYTYPVNLPIAATATATSPNYTLVFDNYVAAETDEQAAQKVVYVALEFKNKLGTDFWGNANMVRDGGTFYLMGKLELTSSLISGFPWDNASPIMPPYYTADVAASGTEPAHKKGDTKHIVRVFMQDFVTKANFVIGREALQAAYVTVPDLRTAKMSFGLSVDLSWANGLVFNDVVLGK